MLHQEPNQEQALAELGWLEYEAGAEARQGTLLSLGEADEQRAERLVPGDFAPHLYLGSMMLAQGDATGAVDQYRRFLADHPPRAKVAAAVPFIIKAFADAHLTPPSLPVGRGPRAEANGPGPEGRGSRRPLIERPPLIENGGGDHGQATDRRQGQSSKAAHSSPVSPPAVARPAAAGRPRTCSRVRPCSQAANRAPRAPSEKPASWQPEDGPEAVEVLGSVEAGATRKVGRGSRPRVWKARMLRVVVPASRASWSTVRWHRARVPGVGGRPRWALRGHHLDCNMN